MKKLDSKELQKIYLAYFARPADPPGIQYWLSNHNKSMTIRDLSEKFSRQEEYINNYSKNKSLESQINNLYINLFNRKIDFDSLNYWLAMVDNENYQISNILYDLLYAQNKSYSRNIKQEEEDEFILSTKIDAAELFTKQISQSFDLVNLYKPDSLSPWISGNSFEKVIDFFNKISNQISIESVDFLIKSLSNSSINIKEQAIDIKDVSLSIPIHNLEGRSLSKKFANKIINLTGGTLSRSKNGTKIIALNNINLTIMKGERVGLIGHNGSGKSSFLRMISGIYLPTSGNIKVLVDVYPMLQRTFLTSSELSGIDACKAHFLLKNHSLDGFESFLDEIIEFSGLGSYISLPVKTYSEGMSARLIFSILTSSPHECLAIDEGFGTGDSDFFDRAEVRMKQFMESAATLFLASHSEELLKQFCKRGIVFSHGSVAFDGPLDAALNYYHTHDYYRKNVIG